MFRKGVLLLMLAGVLDIACKGLVYRTLPAAVQKRMDYIFSRGVE